MNFDSKTDEIDSTKEMKLEPPEDNVNFGNHFLFSDEDSCPNQNQFENPQSIHPMELLDEATKPKAGKDITDVKYRKPFEYGWVREVVYRKKAHNTHNADIYYRYQDKKFRSRSEISLYLRTSWENNLSVDNFLFYPVPLGVGDPHEVVRQAKVIPKPVPKTKKEKTKSVKAKIEVDPKTSMVQAETKLVQPTTAGMEVDPKYLKPFSHGWFREIAFRNPLNTIKQSVADVYYYHPERKHRSRFRSKREIRRYLQNIKQKELTEDNFNFDKIPLGLDSSFENVRNANALHIQNGPEPIKTEEKLKKTINKVSKKSISVDISDPKYREPFSSGWIRELSYRKNRESPSNADVYYYHEGNRFRSRNEVARYLDSIDEKQLTKDNFIFSKVPLGVDSQYETIKEKEKVDENTPNKVEAESTKPNTVRTIDNFILTGATVSLNHSEQQQGNRTLNFKNNLGNSKLLKPFVEGWKREIVFRKHQGKRADIYYHSPTGEKLRSKLEIVKYLKKTKCKTLTVAHFSLSQQSLGLSDPRKEIIRIAGQKTVAKMPVEKTADKISSVKKPTPAFEKPFLYGWRREVVFRADRMSNKADVYYYSPDGQKFRSVTKIVNYLKETKCKTLSRANFTCTQKALGIGDPDKEIVRRAKC